MGERDTGKEKRLSIDSATDNIESEKITASPYFQHIPIGLKKAIAEGIRNKSKANPKFSKQMELFSLIQRSKIRESRNEKFRQAIIDCNWMIYQAPEQGPSFISSDNPGYSLKINDGLTYNTNFLIPIYSFFPFR